MVSTTRDPATPYQAGVDLANQLHGSLLTFDGTQHTVVFQGNTCIDDYATEYLVSGTVPVERGEVLAPDQPDSKYKDHARDNETKV